MKVVLVAGGGIAGLVAAIALLKLKREDIEEILLEQDASSTIVLAFIQRYALGVG
jgi:2-polyprenyl-6-methoxyphenol hydroxylase-like FAD-dependent oxidoreductase